MWEEPEDGSGFWMVLGSGTPTFKHTTLQSARSEAERLARQCPGTKFYILKAQSVCVVKDVHWSPLTFRNADGSTVPF